MMTSETEKFVIEEVEIDDFNENFQFEEVPEDETDSESDDDEVDPFAELDDAQRFFI